MGGKSFGDLLPGGICGRGGPQCQLSVLELEEVDLNLGAAPRSLPPSLPPRHEPTTAEQGVGQIIWDRIVRIYDGGDNPGLAWQTLPRLQIIFLYY